MGWFGNSEERQRKKLEKELSRADDFIREAENSLDLYDAVNNIVDFINFANKSKNADSYDTESVKEVILEGVYGAVNRSSLRDLDHILSGPGDRIAFHKFAEEKLGITKDQMVSYVFDKTAQERLAKPRASIADVNAHPSKYSIVEKLSTLKNGVFDFDDAQDTLSRSPTAKDKQQITQLVKTVIEEIFLPENYNVDPIDTMHITMQNGTGYDWHDIEYTVAMDDALKVLVFAREVVDRYALDDVHSEVQDVIASAQRKVNGVTDRLLARQDELYKRSMDLAQEGNKDYSFFGNVFNIMSKAFSQALDETPQSISVAVNDLNITYKDAITPDDSETSPSTNPTIQWTRG